MVKRVFLVGYMGSGKSTIGRYVAADMKWDFVDMDAYFEQKHQCTISRFFADHGEDAFRRAEHEVVAELCKAERTIVATGGGAPCFFDNMDLMNAAGATIYINVSPDELTARLRTQRDQRPILASKTDDELLDFIGRQLAQREPHYRKAHMVVDGKSLPFDSYRTLIEYFPDELLTDTNP